MQKIRSTCVFNNKAHVFFYMCLPFEAHAFCTCALSCV